jgi:hypothetical protein
MQGRPPFGRVDRFAGEHGIAPPLDVGGGGQSDQQSHRFLGNTVFRVIKNHIVKSGVKALEAIWFGVKKISD